MIWGDKNINKTRVIDSKNFTQKNKQKSIENSQNSADDSPNDLLDDVENELEIYKEYIAYNKKKRLKYLLISVVFILVVVGVYGFVYSNYLSSISIMERQASGYIEEGKLKAAAEIYEKLYDETGEVKYYQEYKYSLKNSENKDLLKEAKNDIKDGDYESALELLITISTNDDKISEQLKKSSEYAQTKWLEKIKEAFNKRDMEYSRREINKFLNILPNSEEGLSISNKISKMIDLTSNFEINEKAKKEQTTQVAQQNRQMFEKAKTIVGTTQYIISDEANVRAEPSKSSTVLDTIKKGKGIYIEEINVESESRIWCKITYYSKDNVSIIGWVSYNTMNGNIK